MMSRASLEKNNFAMKFKYNKETYFKCLYSILRIFCSCYRQGKLMNKITTRIILILNKCVLAA